MKKYLAGYILIMGWIANVYCTTREKKSKTSEPKPALEEKKSKPGSSYSDTLKIDSRSAVFYYPDSFQLEKIKKVTEKNVFESSMHEYFYQVRYVHNFFKKNWPDVKIIDAKNVRYLKFIRAEDNITYIDLDSKNDAFGLFVFDPDKTPIQLELTNAESETGFYFYNKSLRQKK